MLSGTLRVRVQLTEVTDGAGLGEDVLPPACRVEAVIVVHERDTVAGVELHGRRVEANGERTASDKVLYMV
jgi:hypothetical protein